MEISALSQLSEQEKTDLKKALARLLDKKRVSIHTAVEKILKEVARDEHEKPVSEEEPVSDLTGSLILAVHTLLTQPSPKNP